MEKEQLKERIDNILASSSDYETAHGREDKLHLELIRELCPDWVVEEVNRLDAAPFARYCA